MRTEWVGVGSMFVRRHKGWEAANGGIGGAELGTDEVTKGNGKGGGGGWYQQRMGIGLELPRTRCNANPAKG
jgi:hypothetical protein